MNYGGQRLYTIVNVQNISRDMTNDRIRDIFAKYGEISSLKVMNENEPAWRRFAYVAFEDSDAADEAVIELNGQMLDDDRIRVRRTIKKEPGTSKPSWSREYVAKDQSVGDSSASASSNEFAKNLEPVTSNPLIHQLSNENGLNFMALNLFSSAGSSAALSSNGSRRHHNDFSVFVKNLDRSVSRIQLSDAFAPYGKVIWAKIILGPDGLSKGYGFVNYGTAEEARTAIAGMNGRILGPKIIYVEMSRGTVQNIHRFPPRSTYGHAKTEQWQANKEKQSILNDPFFGSLKPRVNPSATSRRSRAERDFVDFEDRDNPEVWNWILEDFE